MTDGQEGTLPPWPVGVSGRKGDESSTDVLGKPLRGACAQGENLGVPGFDGKQTKRIAVVNGKPEEIKRDVPRQCVQVLLCGLMARPGSTLVTAQ